MTSILTTLGVGSGIDVAKLVDDLTAAERAPVDEMLKARREKLEARVSGLAQIQSGLDALAQALSGLASSGTLARTPTSSDSSIVGITASGNADLSSLFSTIAVSKLAAAQSVASGPIADAAAPIGRGQLRIDFGTVTMNGENVGGFTANAARDPITITIDESNDSLDGLKRAINEQSGGAITATIVKDSLGSRLVLKGPSGADLGFTITATPSDGAGAGEGLNRFAFNAGATAMSLKTSAQNAELIVDDITIERSSNTLTDVIAGAKLELKKAEPGTTITLSSTRDIASMRQVVNDVATAFNEVQALIETYTRTDENGVGGPLRSEGAVRDLRAQLASLTSTALLGDDGFTSLSEIGLKTNRDGSISVDSAKLEAVLASAPDRIEKLFVAAQSSGSPLVNIVSMPGRVAAGTYAITDVVPATAGNLTGSAAQTSFEPPVVIDGSNGAFSITVDGRTSLGLMIPAGSYGSGASLAAAMQTAINSDPVLKSFDKAVTVSWDGSKFQFRSRLMGSESTVALSGMDATLATTLGLDAPTAVNGTNASGKIDGRAAIGTGTRLMAPPDSPAAGLVVELLPGATDTRVTMTGGLAGKIKDLRDRLLGEGGGLSSASTRLDKEEQRLDEEAEKLETRMANRREQLIKQFAAMEKAVSAFKSTQTYLQQQIDMWTKSDA